MFFVVVGPGLGLICNNSEDITVGLDLLRHDHHHHHYSKLKLLHLKRRKKHWRRRLHLLQEAERA
jgi:hypothetical protein